jgi:hypothetical protein
MKPTRTRFGLFLFCVVLVTVAGTGSLTPVYGTTITVTAGRARP